MMSLGKTLTMLLALGLLAGGPSLRAQAARPRARAPEPSPAAQEKVLRFLRERFGIPETVKLTMTPLRKSALAGLYEASVTVDDGKQKKTQNILLSRDLRYMVMGDVLDLGAGAKPDAAPPISVRNRPSQGPANAPVTIVEFEDLQCPMCARVHDFLENQLLPRYPGKVRVLYKEFPLVSIHDWSLTAAIANQCAYELNPQTYVPYRTLIFRNQATFNAANARDLLLTYGEQAGVDRVRLAGCLDAKSTLPRIEEDLGDGKRLNVVSTPTCFINGRMIVGLPSVDAYYNAVNDALRGSR